MDQTVNIPRSNTACRCQKSSTIDSDKTQSHWYKEMYGQIHKSTESKKDIILVKLPLTRSRYRAYDPTRGEQQNPYKPTYTFPEELDGDLRRMEDFMKKAASEDLEDDDDEDNNDHVNRKVSSSSPTTNVKDHQTTSKSTYSDDRFASRERPKTNNNDVLTSTITINPRSNPSPLPTTTNDEQKSVYKRILRGGDIPSTGLQKLSLNNREKSNDRDPGESPSRINDSQLIYKALALHNFHAQTNKELPFKKGDIIFIKRRINDDWLEGEYDGKTGIFPVNHVEVLPNESTEGEAIVKYDFIPQNKFELPLKKGDKVILLRKVDNNWYEGELNHMKGIFPIDYVEMIREPKNNSPPKQNVTKAPKSVLKNSTGFQQTAVEKINITPEFPLPKQKCEVLYDYIPQNPDELELHVGDIINIIEMCDDGWYCGFIEKSNYESKVPFGAFPGNYVKILPI